MNTQLTERQALTLGTLVQTADRRHVKFDRFGVGDLYGVRVTCDPEGIIRQCRIRQADRTWWLEPANNARYTEHYLRETNVVWDLDAGRWKLLEGTLRIEGPLRAALYRHINRLVAKAAQA